MKPTGSQVVTLDIFLEHMEKMDSKLDTLALRVSEKDVKIEQRISSLETNQTAAAWIATTLSALVATIVGSAIAVIKWGR